MARPPYPIPAPNPPKVPGTPRTYFLPHNDVQHPLTGDAILNALHVYTTDEVLALAADTGLDFSDGVLLIADNLADALVLAYIARCEHGYPETIGALSPKPRVRAGAPAVDRRSH
jgi:molybdopterin-guanine dinucleotide biosynthesis protein A